MARPSRFDDVRPQLLRELVKDGNVDRACLVVGVVRRTVEKWLERGRDPEHSAFVAFRVSFFAATQKGRERRSRQADGQIKKLKLASQPQVDFGAKVDAALKPSSDAPKSANRGMRAMTVVGA